MAVQYKAVSTSQGFQAIGTYAASAVQTEVWGTGKTTNYSTSLDLNVYYQYPVGIDPLIQVPLIIVLSGGGFDETFVGTGLEDFLGNPLEDHLHLTYWEDMVTAGAVVMAPYYRTVRDTPWNNEDVSSDTNKKKAVRSSFYDQARFIDWVIQYAQRNRALFSIDKRRIFIVGWSAGGVSAIRQAINYPDLFVGVAGFVCGFQLATSLYSPSSSSDHTADIRSFIVETDITVSAPPIKAFLTGDDIIIGGTGNADLRARLQALSAQHPEPEWKANGDGNANHDGPHEWGNWTYDGNSVSTMEGLRRWFNDLMVGVSAKPDSAITFS